MSEEETMSEVQEISVTPICVVPTDSSTLDVTRAVFETSSTNKATVQCTGNILHNTE